jgi:2-methylcitrate dehydratase PrpD
LEYEHGGGEVKRMHAGSAGRNGAQAALLARSGLTGPTSIFDGERGILRMFGGTDEQAPPDQWQHLHIVDTMFRMYPAIGSAAPVLDAAHLLRRQHEFNWRDIVKIRLGVPSFAVTHGVSVTRPKDTVSAQFSTGFGLALLLCRGAVRLADYADPQAWEDPDLLSVIDRIEPYATEFAPGWPPLSCRMDIVLRDRRVLSHAQRGFRGHPDDPETTDALFEEKFRTNVAGLLEPAATERVIELVRHLDELSGVGELMALIRG